MPNAHSAFKFKFFVGFLQTLFTFQTDLVSVFVCVFFFGENHNNLLLPLVLFFFILLLWLIIWVNCCFARKSKTYQRARESRVHTSDQRTRHSFECFVHNFRQFSSTVSAFARSTQSTFFLHLNSEHFTVYNCQLLTLSCHEFTRLSNSFWRCPSLFDAFRLFSAQSVSFSPIHQLAGRFISLFRTFSFLLIYSRTSTYFVLLLALFLSI